jgi:microtubule-associated protein 1 light chain
MNPVSLNFVFTKFTKKKLLSLYKVMLPFRHRLSLDQRIEQLRQVQTRHPNHVPVIFERIGREMPRIDKEKFLVPPTLTAAQLAYIVRKRIRLDSSQALFLFCGKRLLSGATEIASLYDQYMYIGYSLENTFGYAPTPSQHVNTTHAHMNDLPDATSPDTRRRLFWFICIPLRFSIALILFVWGAWSPILFGVFFLAVSVTLFSNVVRTLAGSKTHGGFGGVVWWDKARMLHSLLWGSAGLLSVLKETQLASVLLFADVASAALFGALYYRFGIRT